MRMSSPIDVSRRFDAKQHASVIGELAHLNNKDVIKCWSRSKALGLKEEIGTTHPEKDSRASLANGCRQGSNTPQFMGVEGARAIGQIAPCVDDTIPRLGRWRLYLQIRLC